MLPFVWISWPPLPVTVMHLRSFSVQMNLSLLSYLPLFSWTYLALPPNQSAVPVPALYSPLLGLCPQCTCHVRLPFPPRVSTLNSYLSCKSVVLPPVHMSSQKYPGPLIDARNKNKIIFKILVLVSFYKPFENVHFM